MDLYEVDRKRLHDDLVEAFIRYQYRLENPMFSPEETDEEKIHKYRNDPFFHRKVDSLASGTMYIFNEYIKKAEGQLKTLLMENGINNLQSHE